MAKEDVKPLSVYKSGGIYGTVSVKDF